MFWSFTPWGTLPPSGLPVLTTPSWVLDNTWLGVGVTIFAISVEIAASPASTMLATAMHSLEMITKYSL
jgi:hypothetical protein